MMAILAAEKQEDRRSSREERTTGEELDGVVEIMEDGLCQYMSHILGELFRINHMMNINKTLNGLTKEKMVASYDSSPFLNVLLFDPFGEYKLVEKIEMEEQKKNENKIQNKDQQQKAEEDKVSQKPQSDANNQAVAKKKKAVFDDVGPSFDVVH